MDNFIFSVNVTIPIFLIILLGYILRRIGFLTDEFVRVANKYVFIVALPVMLFRDIAGSDVRKDMNVKFFLFCMIVTIIMFFLVWGIAKLYPEGQDNGGCVCTGRCAWKCGNPGCCICGEYLWGDRHDTAYDRGGSSVLQYIISHYIGI